MKLIVSEPLRQLVGYWHKKAALADGRPRREHILPAEIPKLLDRILMVDVLDGPPHFQNRLVGTKITSTVGRDATGRPVDQSLYGASAGVVREAYQRVVDMAVPLHHGSGSVTVEPEQTAAAEIVLVPIFNAHRVEIILCGIDIRYSSASVRNRADREGLEIRPGDARPIQLASEATTR